MESFNKKNLLQLKKMSLEEVKKYYVELRNFEYDNNIPLKGIALRQKIHKILLHLITIDRLLQKDELVVISDKHVKSNKPIVYACTHIGGDDIQRTFEAIKDHAYLFLGDPEGIYQDFTGVILNLNGAICLETSNKKDRHIAKERSIELLKKGGSLLIYPEGAWNITDNLPVMKLYSGAVKMALETGADIVPIAIEQYENRFFVNIGENIKMEDNIDLSITNLNLKLRDELATLKWEIWEKNGLHKRSSVPENFREQFQQQIIDKCEYGFTVEDVYNTMYKDPNEPSPDEVFSYIKKISH